jgi:hypothetical protein
MAVMAATVLTGVMSVHPRTVWRLLGVLFFAMISLGGCSLSNQRAAECRLSPRAHDAVPRAVLSSRAYYLQRDSRWVAEKIGGSGKTLGTVGCTVCCLSMALAQYGVERSPAELNRELKKVEGFNDKGWVRWAAIQAVTGGKVRAEVLSRPTHRDIQEALAAGNPVLVKVAPGSMIQHWVLLVGRDGREYLMKDPLDDGKKVKALSSLGSDILAVRIVKRSAP